MSIPEDSDSNNITILIEAKAVEAVYTPEEYAQLKANVPKSKTHVRHIHKFFSRSCTFLNFMPT